MSFGFGAGTRLKSVLGIIVTVAVVGVVGAFFLLGDNKKEPIEIQIDSIELKEDKSSDSNEYNWFIVSDGKEYKLDGGWKAETVVFGEPKNKPSAPLLEGKSYTCVLEYTNLFGIRFNEKLVECLSSQN